MVIGRARARTLVALLFILGAAACNGSDSPGATNSPSPTVIPTAKLTPTSSALTGLTREPPARDLSDLARRFRGAPSEPPLIARDTPYGYVAGDSAVFSVLDLSSPSIRTITATVRLITDHAYFFVEDGLAYSDAALETIGSDFESLIYPSVRRDFGPEPAPGVDSDPRITVLHANLHGAGGYYSLSDEFPRVVAPRSNEREMVYLDADVLGAPGPPYNGLLAHELQHLVHWNADPTEDSWVNEGLSQVAAEQVGGGGDWLDSFLQAPDTPLTFWPEIEDSIVHYAASELFFSYLLDHYGGRERARDILEIGEDGIDGIDAYLSEFGKTFTDVFADWTAANWLDADEGPYSHPGHQAQTRVSSPVAPEAGDGTVGQFGTDYLEVNGAGVLTFDGADEVGVGVPQSGGAYWWSNRGDGIDTRLTREVDLRGVQAATLRFRTWYDTELGWDYGYVAVSDDGGRTWRALPGRQTTDHDPVELSYGPGYSGQSGGWVEEQVDLTAYAGREVLLRFEYVTDDATSLTGFAIDDIEIPEIGIADNVETAGEWKEEGFVRITRSMRQEFIVQVIEEGTPPAVTRVHLDASNQARIALNGPAVVAVSGATRGTAERANYAWTFR